MAHYLLEKRNAVKLSQGIYRWSFNLRNEVRPNRVIVGPCSVSTSTDQRNVVILSDTFRNSDRNTVYRGDELKPVLTVVHAQQHHKHTYTAPSTDITVAQILDLATQGHVTIWLDLHDPSFLLNAAMAPASVGESINRLISRVPGGTHTFYASGVDKVQKAALGNSYGLSQQTAAAWAYSVETSSTDNTPEFAYGTSVFLLKAPPTVSGLEVIYQSKRLHLFFYSSQIQYKDSSGSYVATGVSVLPGQDYVLEIEHTLTGTEVKLTRLADDTVQEYSGVETTPLSGTATYKISTAQSHQLGTFGSMIHMDGDAAARQLCVNYFKQLYAAASVPEVTTSYQLYDDRKTSIRMDQPSESIKNVELEFQDQAGQRIDPSDCVISLEVTPAK